MILLYILALFLLIISWAVIDYKIKTRRHRRIYQDYLKSKERLMKDSQQV